MLGDDPFVFAASTGPTHSLAVIDASADTTSTATRSCFWTTVTASAIKRSRFARRPVRTRWRCAPPACPPLRKWRRAALAETLLPSLAIDVENRRETLRIRRFAGDPPKRTIALVWRRGSALEPTLHPIGQTMGKVYRKLSY